MKKLLGFLLTFTLAFSAQAQCIWTDNPQGPSCSIVPQRGGLTLGTAKNPFGNIYGTFVGTTLLPNNTFLASENFLGTGVDNLLKADASDNTVLNAKTAKKGSFRVNDVEIGSYNATTFTFPAVVGTTGTFSGAVSGTTGTFSAAAQATAFNLADGSDKNHPVTSFASGTAYALTNTSATLALGTSTASVVLDKAGTYLLLGKANLEYAGATFAANRTVTLKLRRTNNTAADVTGSSTALGTNVVTTVTGVMSAASLPPVTYTTTNTNDIIQIFGDVSVVPTAGALNATEANIIAIRLY